MPAADHVAEARAVYDASADRYVDFVGTELGPATETADDLSSLRTFVELTTAGGNRRVADVGCGPGRAAAFCAAHGLDVTGFDISPALLAVARRAHPGMRFALGRLDDLPLEDRSLGGIVCWYSIINTPPAQIPAVGSELARVLDPGGHLLVAFQAGRGDAVTRSDAHGSGLALTSYRHSVSHIGDVLRDHDLEVHTATVRDPELPHESAPQAVVIARRR